MKKIYSLLLSIIFVHVTWSQSVTRVAINELYVNPGSGHAEFFELYNNSAVGLFSLDTFSILTYWDNGLSGSSLKRGFYVLDLPAVDIPSHGFVVGASGNPFDYQTSCSGSPLQGTAQINWNGLPASGSLKLWVEGTANLLDGNPNYDEQTITGLGVDFNDFFFKKGGGGFDYGVLVFRYRIATGTTELVNTFFGGYVGTTLPSEISGMPSLFVDMNLSGTDYTIDFTTLPNVVEQENSSAGTDNGYGRTQDGQCGQWGKTSSGCDHNPGFSNGTLSTTGALTTEEIFLCPSTPDGTVTAKYNITAGPTEAFPVEVQVWENSTFDVDINSVFHGGSTISGARAPGTYDQITYSSAIKGIFTIIVYITQDGCSDQKAFADCAILPITLISFTASKENSNVILNWQTASEFNNKGFEIQRKSGNNDFETIGFVPSQGKSGSSYSKLSYEFSETNIYSGITQYRLKQIDIDGKFSYSVIRVIQGENNKSVIRVFPNPSTDGRFTILMNKTNGNKDVSLIDLNGRILRQWKNVQSDILQAENIQPGFYLLNIIDRQNNKKTILKVVVSKN